MTYEVSEEALLRLELCLSGEYLPNICNVLVSIPSIEKKKKKEEKEILIHPASVIPSPPFHTGRTSDCFDAWLTQETGALFTHQILKMHITKNLLSVSTDSPIFNISNEQNRPCVTFI